MNPYYYLFYKLNRFLNKKGDNEWGPIYGLTFFTFQYIAIFFVKAFSMTQSQFNEYKFYIGGVAISFFILNSILFLSKKRVQKIIEQYKSESIKSRKAGNILLALYVIIPLGLILFW